MGSAEAVKGGSIGWTGYSLVNKVIRILIYSIIALRLRQNCDTSLISVPRNREMWRCPALMLIW